MAMNEAATSKLELPGFRFHPTEEELLDFYLKNTIFGKRLNYDVIGVLNIYRHDPWYLPGLAKIGEREWYFFVPRDTKHGSGGRPNRTTEHGFWKATGSDRKIFSLSGTKRCIGLRKTLVFYKGRAPNGTRTDWVMNEYRLPDSRPSHKDMVLCKIYRKATSLKVLEQRAAMEEEEVRTISSTPPPPPPPSPSPLTPPISMETVSFCSQPEDFVAGSNSLLKKEDEEAMPTISEEIFHNDETGEIKSPLSLQLPTGMEKLELQLPKFNKDLSSHDPFLTPLCSPWLDNWLIPYVLNL